MAIPKMKSNPQNSTYSLDNISLKNQDFNNMNMYFKLNCEILKQHFPKCVLFFFPPEVQVLYLKKKNKHNSNGRL